MKLNQAIRPGEPVGFTYATVFAFVPVGLPPLSRIL